MKYKLIKPTPYTHTHTQSSKENWKFILYN